MQEVLERVAPVVKKPKKNLKKIQETEQKEMIEALDTNLEKINTINLLDEIRDIVDEEKKPEPKWRNVGRNNGRKEINKKDIPVKSTQAERSKGLKIAVEEFQGLIKFKKKGKYGVQDTQGIEIIPPKFDKIDILEDIDFGITIIACQSDITIDIFKYTKPINPSHN